MTPHAFAYGTKVYVLFKLYLRYAKTHATAQAALTDEVDWDAAREFARTLLDTEGVVMDGLAEKAKADVRTQSA